MEQRLLSYRSGLNGQGLLAGCFTIKREAFGCQFVVGLDDWRIEERIDVVAVNPTSGHPSLLLELPINPFLSHLALDYAKRFPVDVTSVVFDPCAAGNGVGEVEAFDIGVVHCIAFRGVGLVFESVGPVN